MVLFNYSTKELTAKIVYYGPGLCGKTTNLQYIHANLPGNIKGKMLSLATKTDRTLFFDFLPLDLGMIRGMKTRIQLYTVPGQVFYNETRKLVLKGADGIVFVADSQETMAGANVEAFKNLEENLRAHGLNLSEMPHVIQFNKRDLPRLSGIEEMNSAINRYNAPFYESVATNGIGVQDTLKAITKLVLLNLTQKYDPRTGKGVGDRAAAAAAPAVEAPPVPAVEMPPEPEPAAPVAAAAEPEVTGIPLSPSEGAMATPEAGLPMTASEPPAEAPDLPPSMTLPEPPDFGGGGGLVEDEVPEFDDTDIDDLVGEVGDREFDEPAVGEAAAATAPEQAPEQEAFDLSGEAAVDDLPSFTVDTEPDDVREDIPVEMPAAGEPGSLEVDRGFDPDWDIGSDEPVSVPEPETPLDPDPDPVEVAMPASEFEPETAAGEVPGDVAAEPVAEDEPVRLTEVVEDEPTVSVAGLDLVRLQAGDTTEIVLPVELERDGERNRYRLHLNLRLDHVD